MCIPLIKLYSLCFIPAPNIVWNVFTICEAIVPSLNTIIASSVANILLLLSWFVKLVVLMSIILDTLASLANKKEAAIAERIKYLFFIDKYLSNKKYLPLYKKNLCFS